MNNTKRKTERLVAEMPPQLLEMIDKTAARKFCSRSQYTRDALLEALARDGVVPLNAA
jgi:metal-responsive CopG/Arc/MetJ family transcriptional regulator